MRALRGANAAAVLHRLNPIIRGWAAYYRTVVSSEAFAALDSYLWRLTYKWAKHGHPNKSKHWVVNRYFGAFNKSRRDRWVFGDRDSGAYLHQVRLDQDRPTPDGQGQVVPGRPGPGPVLGRPAAPRRTPADGPGSACGCCRAQHGRCPLCGDLLLHADHPPQTPAEWEQWVRVTGKALRKQSLDLPAARRVGRDQQPPSRTRSMPRPPQPPRHAAQHFCTAREPSGLA